MGNNVRLLGIDLSVRVRHQSSLHGEKFICKLHFFHKKINHFHNGAGTHSTCGIFFYDLNSKFYDFRGKFDFLNNNFYYFCSKIYFNIGNSNFYDF